MQLVDEHDDLPSGRLDFLEDRLETLLELAAKLRASNQRSQIERDDRLVAKSIRNVSTDDTLSQPFRDRRLAHAGLPDQHRIVLGAARQHLDHPPNLLIAPDNGIQLAFTGKLGEVTAVLLQGLVGALRVGIGYTLVAADVVQGAIDAILVDTIAPKHRFRLAALHADDAQQQMLGADVFVAELAGFGFRLLQRLAKPGTHNGICRKLKLR